MKIHIVNYELGIKSGILTKYADRMVNGIIRLGEVATVSGKPNPKADVNHHINYASYRDCPGVNTTMVTHIDTDEKLEFMKKVAKVAHGVCFSKETMDFLIQNGVKKDSVSVILPASDIVRRPRIVAILTQLYPDGRKREGMFLELLKTLDPKDFVFNIVGEGWGKIVEEAKKNFHILWQEQYTPELGQGILNNADYLVYFGKDEGAMSVLDAAVAGVKTIAPSIGFHKELGIDYPFDTQEELNEVFKELSVGVHFDCSWDRYVKNHLDLWRKLTKN